MAAVGTQENPLRVAIIGSGPSGFYTVSNLLKQSDLVVEMDMFDRLPTPYGLVRAGVAPDHQKDKSVTRAYEKSAAHPGFRFFGNVEYGTHIHMTDLKAHYHQVMFTTGSPFDRNLGIPGEDLLGSHSATNLSLGTTVIRILQIWSSISVRKTLRLLAWVTWRWTLLAFSAKPPMSSRQQTLRSTH